MPHLEDLFTRWTAELFLQSDHVLLAIIDAQGLLIEWNYAVGRLNPAIKEGFPVEEVLAQAARGRFLKIVEDAVRDGQSGPETLHFASYSQSLPMSFRCNLVRHDDGRILLSGLPVPELNQREAQEYLLVTNELASTTRELQKAKHALEMSGRELADVNANLREEISARTVAEEEVRRKHEELRAIFSVLPDEYYRIDARGTILDRQGGEAPSDRTEDTASGCFHDLIPGSVRDEFIEKQSLVTRTRNRQSVEYLLRDEQGQASYYEAGLFALSGEEVIVVVRDITHIRRAETAMLHHERLVAVSNLASGVAHHFNNLLQVVISASQLAALFMEEGKLEEARAGLRQIDESVETAAGISKRLQSFAGIRREPGTGGGSVFDLSETVERAVELSRVWVEQASVEDQRSIDIELRLDSGCYVIGFESAIFDVMINLLRNAFEAMPDGGRIEVAGSCEGEAVRISIRDTGTGIAPEHLSRIFEPFFTTKGYQTPGMGLPSSLGTVRSMNGDIGVESTPGEGTTFIVTLPGHAPTVEQVSVPEDKVSTPPASLNLLLVDDDARVRESVKRSLVSRDHAVITAASAEEGLRLTGEYEFDAVVCDLGMPGMNGSEMARKLKDYYRNASRPRPRFLLFTGWDAKSAAVDRSTESGIDAVMEKPVDADKMLSVLSRLIRNPDMSKSRSCPKSCG